MTPCLSAPKPIKMGYQPESPLLRFPVEVRLEIYRHFWTIPCEKKHLVRRCAYKLKVTFLKAQLSAICTLGAICRRIRDEDYAEYFHITQARYVCLRWVYVDYFKDTLEEQLEEELEAREIDDLERTNTNLNIVMNCLKTRFQNAITLDIVCDEIWFEDSIWRKWREDVKNDLQMLQLLDARIYSLNSLTTNYYNDRGSERIRSLRFRNLEKAVVRTCLTDPDGVKWFNKENLAWFQRLKEDVATLGAPRKEGQEERSYRFKNHIGALDLNWPRFDRI
ncbi:hypothetical protein N0V85_006916 [Neurospora sp. IMI 360204]|nr:hypothetical protein N0V85_006916 [Neurospora sp. IMI 360204]